MGPAEFAWVRGTGRKGLSTARLVSGPAGNDARPVSSSDGGVMASDKSVRVWETVYRRYGQVWELTARAPKGDPAAAREMAAASRAVAAAWRQIAAATTLPWWTLVAVETAAAAFEAQAREYQARQESESP